MIHLFFYFFISVWKTLNETSYHNSYHNKRFHLLFSTHYLMFN